MFTQYRLGMAVNNRLVSQALKRPFTRFRNMFANLFFDARILQSGMAPEYLVPVVRIAELT